MDWNESGSGWLVTRTRRMRLSGLRDLIGVICGSGDDLRRKPAAGWPALRDGQPSDVIR